MSLWPEFKKWLRTHSVQALTATLVGALLGSVLNTVCLIFVNEGFNITRADAVKYPLGVSLFCMVLCSLASYTWAVGPRRAWQDLRDFPAHAKTLMDRGGRVHLLWGAASSLVISSLLSPILGRVVGGVFGVGLALAVPSLLGRFFSNMLLRVYSTIIGWVSPTRKVKVAGPVSVAVGLLGSSAALLAAVFLGPNLRLLAAGGCVLFAYRSGGGPIKALFWLALIGCDWFHQLAWADDGGWSEVNGSSPVTIQTLINWARSQGAGGVVVAGVLGGSVSGGVGGAVGSGLGGVASGGPYGWPDGQTPKDVMDQLEHEVTDPDLYERLKKLREESKNGKIDEDKLRELAEEQERIRQGRIQQIDDQHQRNTDEFRQRKEAEERAREEAIKARQKEQLEKANKLIGGVKDDIRRGNLENFLDRHKDNPEELAKAIEAIRHGTVDAEQQRNMGDSEQAQEESKALGRSEEYTKDVRDWSKRINGIIAKNVPKALKPAADLINDVQDAIYSGIDGYDKGGMKGAVQHTAASALDNFTHGMSTPILNADNDVGKGLTDWAKNKVDKFNPFSYAERIKNAKGIGDLVDAATDAHDAKNKGQKWHKDWTERSRGDDDRSAEPRPPRPDEETPPARPRPQQTEDEPQSPGRPQPTEDEPQSPRRPQQTEEPPRVKLGGEEPAPARRKADDETIHADRPDNETGAEKKFDKNRRDAQDVQDEWRDKLTRQQRAEAERDEAAADAERTGTKRHKDKLEKAQEAADRAREEADAARKKFDVTRQKLDDQDPRGQLRQRENERRDAGADLLEAEEKARNATQQERAEAEQRVQKAQERLDQAEQDQKDAQDRVRAKNRQEHAETARVDAEVAKTVKPDVKPSGPMKTFEDTRGLTGQYNEDAPKKDIDVPRVTAKHENMDDTTDRVEVAGAKRKDMVNAIKRGELAADEHKPGEPAPDGKMIIRDGDKAYAVDVADAREVMKDNAEEVRPENLYKGGDQTKGMHGYHKGGADGTSNALNDEGTKRHERTHPTADEKFLKEYGKNNTNLTEGITEHLTRKGLNKQPDLTPEQKDRSGHYDQPAAWVGHLEGKVGEKAIHDAYARGDMREIYEKLGGADGPTQGRMRFDNAQAELRKGNWQAARDALDE